MHSSSSCPTAVLFDYGNVLSTAPDDAAWQQMVDLLAVPSEDLHNAYWRHRDAYDRGLSATDYWYAVAAELGHSLRPGTLDALLDADLVHWGQPNPEMVAWAAQLQAAHVPTGVLSNLGDAMEIGLLRRLPWLSAFPSLTFSHRLGIAKPDLAIYEAAASSLGQPAASILFLDDREDNIAGAEAAGLQTLQFTTFPALSDELTRRGWSQLLSPSPLSTS